MIIHNPTAPASEKQIAYIRSLIAQRDQTATQAIRDRLNNRTGAHVTKEMAHDAINDLRAIPMVGRPINSLDKIEEGYYVDKQSNVYVVVMSKSGRKYAKRLEVTAHGRAKWEYRRGAIYQLDGLTALTPQEAGRLGHLHGVCVICTRALTDPESVANGVGPVCVKRLLSNQTVLTPRVRRVKEKVAEAKSKPKPAVKPSAPPKANPEHVPSPTRKRRGDMRNL